MSRVPKPRGAIPKAVPRASSSRPSAAKSSVSKTSLPDKKKKAPDKKKEGAAKAAEQAEAVCKIPAFSIAMKAPKAVAKDKTKHVRRNKPPGEDLKKLKEIMLSVRGQDVTVQEFIGLVAPSTGDNGECLRLSLAEDLNTFRNTARKIYETMTQDVSEVLTNEHIILTENSQERHELYVDKMVRSMNLIFQLVPDFDFEKYYTEPGYMESKFEMAKEVDEGSEEHQGMMRQEAYHRYQWLKSEGERLKNENTRLQKRMNQLKKQQKDALALAAERERKAEEQRAKLEETQEDLQEQLEELNVSVEKVLVESERDAVEKVKLVRKSPPAKLSPVPPRKPSRKPPWAAQAAAKMETESAASSIKAESSKISVKASSAAESKSKLGAKKKKLKKKPAFSASPIKSPSAASAAAPAEEPVEELSELVSWGKPRKPKKKKSPEAFHYSPPKTPPGGWQQQEEIEQLSESMAFGQPRRAKEKKKSPEAFHYSPPKTPPGGWQQEQTPTPVGRRRIETSETVIQQQPISAPRYGRAGAPRDSWGGFG